MLETQSFWEMGGYAAYVWPAYAFTLIMLMLMGAGAWTVLRKAKRA